MLIENKIIFPKGLSEIINNYDAFIVDLWGVMHDGVEAFPGSLEVIEQLHKNNKEVIFLSNAPRRSKDVYKKLDQLNIDRKLYKEIITSGEVIYDIIKNRKTNDTENLGNKYFYIGPERDISLLEETDFVLTNEIQQANFILITGFIADNNDIIYHLPILKKALSLNLPAFSANPDLIVVRKNGKFSLCGGTLASEYKKMGGSVFEYGKPFTPGYQICMKLFKAKDKKRVLAVGDSFITDILGAKNFGIDSMLVSSGIHQDILIKNGKLLPEENIIEVCHQKKLFPNYVVKDFTW